MASINWQDLNAPISKYFKVKEALWLPQFKVYHQPTEQEQWNIYFLAAKLDKVRELVGRPMIVHCYIRPIKVNCPDSEFDGKDYNTLVKGASNSAHIFGNACDFNFEGKATAEECHEMRGLLILELQGLGLRMENKEGAWIHLDRNKVPVGGNYYFKP